MINIKNSVIKQQENFWNNCIFHPTDGIEDFWGKRILDRMADDKAINMIRIYTMFEDIVYEDMDGNLCYDFRVNDLRLDYLVEKGYNLLLTFATVPDCIAKSTDNKTSVALNKTRYKGKMWNSAPPKDYALWEEVCYQYTKHIVERYGIDLVSKWNMMCFNEPNYGGFFMSELPREATKERALEYCKLYASFEKGIRRVSDKIKIGGPALAGLNIDIFLSTWLEDVKANNLKLDFISIHTYGMYPDELDSGTKIIDVNNNIEKHKKYIDIIEAHGFEDTPIIVDEWGFATDGFSNIYQHPLLIHRETEVFSAFFAKLIYTYIHSGYKMEQLMICLSGQHETTEDFFGSRNFFTKNFITKPIYNCYVLAGRLYKNLLEFSSKDENIMAIPTKDDNGNYAVMLSYSDKNFTEEIPTICEKIKFEDDLSGKKITVWCIDKENTNPYRLYQKSGMDKNLSQDEIKILREEGKLKPIHEGIFQGEIELKFSPNATYLITVE